MDVNLGDLLRRRARTTPLKQAVVDLTSGTRVSYPELNARVNAVAHALRDLGVCPCDRVALLCHNSIEFIECYYAVAKLGAVVVPLNWRLTAPELTFILKDCGAKVLVFGSAFAEVSEAIRMAGSETDVEHFVEIGAGTGWATPYAELVDYARTHEPEIPPGWDEPVTIVYTSGTTGLPKGVVHTHRTAYAGIQNVLATIELAQSDRYLLVLPLFHVGASTPMLAHLYRGGCLYLLSQFDPAKMWEVIETERITKTLAVPAMLNFMLQVPGFQDRDLSSLNSILSGASPVPVDLIHTYHAMGIQIHQVYGMTETFGPGCFLGGDEAEARAGSTGRPYMLTDVRLIDEHGNDVPPGTPGQVIMHGAHNMIGYWNRPHETAETIRDGWLYSGDIGIADEDGYITIHDRVKDMIISGGENVYPAEIENVLISHHGVADVAVIGQPSETWGECPLAVVVRAGPDVTKAEIMAHCQARLARYKQPKAIAFIDEIPRNPTGKALKWILRERFPGPAPE